ncbi:MAG: adenylate cyclase, partial [Granulosicoccus sp.]
HAHSAPPTWWRDSKLETNVRIYTSKPQEQWLRSSWYWMLTERVRELRQDLRDGATVAKDFPIYDKFRSSAASDYFASLIPFGTFE